MKVKAFRFSKRKVEKTGQDKPVRAHLTKKNYVQMLGEASKWPLSIRVAAELWRSGVRVDEFENEMHFEDNAFSRAVYEHLMQFHFNKGYNPDVITPVRPVYLRYDAPDKVKEKEFINREGRPSTEEAVQYIRRLIRKKCEQGWKELDFIKALRVIDTEGEPEIIKSKVVFKLDESDVKVVRRRMPPIFHVLVEGKWQQAGSAKSALKLKELAEIRAEAVEPVKQPKRICCHCRLALSSLVITLRGEGKRQKDKNMHEGCYYMNEFKPSDIPLGMKVLNPKEGMFYQWTGIPDGKGNGGWKDVKTMVAKPGGQNEKQEEKTASSGVNSTGVPASSGKESKSAAPLPVEANT